MKSYITLSFLLALMLFSGFSYADEMIEEEESEVKFKTKIPGEKEGTKLGITGLGCREKYWVNVYAIAHFADYAGLKSKLSKWKGKAASSLTSDLKFYEALCTADVEKTFVLVFVRDVDASDIKDAFRESLGQTYKKGLPSVAEDFLKYFNDGIKEKEKMVFKSLTGGRLSITVAGKTKKIIEDKKLAAAVWRIWFCEEPTVGTDLRDALISEIKRAWNS